MSTVRFALSNGEALMVLVDDCWSIKSGRNSTTHRIMPDMSKFPQGIDGFVSQVHEMGFKAGIYSSMFLDCSSVEIRKLTSFRRRRDDLCWLPS